MPRLTYERVSSAPISLPFTLSLAAREIEGWNDGVVLDSQAVSSAQVEVLTCRCGGYTYPNYVPNALSQYVCRQNNLQCEKIHFYTGVHRSIESKFWYDFWSRKFGALGTRGVDVFSRSLAYCDETAVLDDGTKTTVRLPGEKGVDVRLALDVVG